MEEGQSFYGERIANNVIDDRARSMVRRYLEEESTADEERLRCALAGLVAEAHIPESVARSFARLHGSGYDVQAELVGRLHVYLLHDVREKLDLMRLLDSSLCSWARALLSEQVKTAARSEWRSWRRTAPLPDPASIDDVLAANTYAGASEPEMYDEARDIASAEVVSAARVACRADNDVHLVEYMLRAKYGFKAPEHNAQEQDGHPALVMGRFAERARELLGQDADYSDLPSDVVKAIKLASSAPRHAPRRSVVRAFLDMVIDKTSEDLGLVLATAWLARWTDVRPDGSQKADGERKAEMDKWSDVADKALVEDALGATSTSSLDQAMERIFWSAHYVVGSAKRRRAA